MRYGAMILGGLLLLFVLMWGMSNMGGSTIPSEQKNPDTSNTEIPLLGGAGGGLDSTAQYQKEQDRKNQEYNRLVKLADGKYNQQQWKDAKSYYQQAANYKNTQHVKDRIGGIDWKLKQGETAKQKTPPPSEEVGRRLGGGYTPKPKNSSTTW
ncbi:MAG: hypothetical protein ACPGVB_14480 [Chitinophagales bacterium]